MEKKILVFTLAVVILCPAQVRGAGLAGADFLIIKTSPRAAALGEAYVALADDTSSLQWNPAGLTGITNIQMEFNHVQYFVDTRIEYGAFVAALTPKDLLGISLYFDTIDDLYETDDVGFAQKALAYNVVIQAAYARSLNEALSVGLGLKTYQSVLLDSKAGGWAIDFGGQYKFGERVQLGVSLLNVGPEIVYERVGDPLPHWGKIGGTVLVVDSRPHSLSVTAEGNVPLNHKADIYGNFGIEYGVADIVFLRTGFSSALGRRRMVYGAGIGYRGFIFNYAFVPFGVLGNNHMLSIQVSLKERESKIESWTYWIKRGDKAFARMDFGMASDSYKTAAEINPGILEVWKKLGKANMKRGREEEALRAYKEARRLDPSDKEAALWLESEILRLGNIRFEAKDYSAALEHYLAVLEIDPSDVIVWRKLGWTYYRLGRNQDTIQAFLEAYRLDPTDVELKKWLQTITRDQN